MFRDRVRKAIEKAVGEEVVVEFPQEERHGDYSTNYALQRSGYKNPKDFAKKVVGRLKKDQRLKKLVGDIKVEGPGFINFFVKKEVLLEEAQNIVAKGDNYGKSDIGKGKTVIIDYSAPNIAKRFGIGHLRSTIIGQALYNIYSHLGFRVIGDNHIGDWGTQFGSLLYQITESGKDPKDLTIGELESMYVDFEKKAEEVPELRDEARKWFKKLEDGEPEAREIWETVRNISMQEFDRIYKILGVSIDQVLGESFYEDKMSRVIQELGEKGLLEKSEGAQVVKLKDMPAALVLKSDSATTYLTRDLATIDYRIKKWDPDTFIYEVGVEQSLHFKQLFEVARLLGWAKGREFVHLGHGLIRFEHGKMSTRYGMTIKLEEVLDQAIERAKEIIENSETGRNLKEVEKEKVARAVGIGAIKYFDLMHHPTTDIIFSWEKIFVLEGNSAPYLQYSFARTKSVLDKTKKDPVNPIKLDQSLDPKEEDLIRCFPRFSETIVDASNNYSPNLLANYLFELAQKFNSFYNENRILGDEKEDLRILLTAATGQLLENGLKILGIETPEKM
jgi:arginyl-tRNA synthetase